MLKPCRYSAGNLFERPANSPQVVPRALTEDPRYEGAHGNVRHVHERLNCELPLDRGIDYDQLQLS